jgi:hypothetical protein
VNLVLFGMQQGRAGSVAGIIHGVIACYEHGRSIQNDTDCWRGNCFKADCLVAAGHAGARSATEPSATDAWRMAAAGDATEVVLIDRDYKAKETPATREQGTPDFFWAPRRRLAHELEELWAPVRPAEELTPETKSAQWVI